MALVSKPASTTPSNTGSWKSCGTARFCNEEAHKYTSRCATRSTYGTGIEHHKEGAMGYIWYHKAYIILLQIDDLQCHNQTHAQWINSGHHTGQEFKVYVSVAEQHTAEQSSKRAGQNPDNISHEASIMEYSPGLLQNTKSLRSCSWNRGKMFLKSHLGIKCHSQYISVIRLL